MEGIDACEVHLACARRQEGVLQHVLPQAKVVSAPGLPLSSKVKDIHECLCTLNVEEGVFQLPNEQDSKIVTSKCEFPEPHLKIQ
jgi:hypothetical protein